MRARLGVCPISLAGTFPGFSQGAAGIGLFLVSAWLQTRREPDGEMAPLGPSAVAPPHPQTGAQLDLPPTGDCSSSARMHAPEMRDSMEPRPLLPLSPSPSLGGWDESRRECRACGGWIGYWRDDRNPTEQTSAGGHRSRLAVLPDNPFDDDAAGLCQCGGLEQPSALGRARL